MNLQIAQVYLQHSDPTMATRTWKEVFDKIISTKTGSTQERWKCAAKDKAFHLIRDRKVVETTSDHFLAVLQAGTVATNFYLRRTHHFAIGMHWLPWPVLPKLHWPPIVFKKKRAITLEEHEKIVANECNAELKAYYQMLWHIGGAQSDVAALKGEDIDWDDHTITFRRKKTGTLVHLTLGSDALAALEGLPKSGPLFPRLSKLTASDRAAWFVQKLKAVQITGISLHCYRYAWAERARQSGYPEQYAMQALGHHSEAVHRAYAKNAKVKLPSLQEFESKIVQLPMAVNQ
ncbi:MAG: tyrosine-type recombinase/integrase [Verrucomicrobia bacterium]|nr:tyrosine-type recombinase/integrase [Verrucomicrobiota bacterium]